MQKANRLDHHRKGARMKYEEQIKKFDRKIDDFLKENSFSGTVRVTIRDEVVYERSIGFADSENGIPFSGESMFTLYSLSKPFCAIGLMKLVECGKVNLDAHPSLYVPEASGFDSTLKVSNLLNHTSGIPDFVRNAEFYGKHGECENADLRTLLKELATYKPSFLPGKGALYANVNYILSAMIIENVSKMKYADYMEKEVFLPLGLKNAKVDNPTLSIKNRVTGYERDSDGKIIPVSKMHYSMFGAGDVIATVDDVYRLNIAIKNRLMLREETWQKILTPSPIHNMGFGCNVATWNGKLRIQHNGGSRGFRTLHIQIPEDDFDFIILSNSAFSDVRIIFADYVYESFYGDENKLHGSAVAEMDKGYI